MDFKDKRLISFYIALGYTFIGACELAMILPTIWTYLRTLGVRGESWVGIAISAPSISSAFAGLVVGRLSDKFSSHTKIIVVGCCIFRIIGSLQYMLGKNIWNVISGRFISGFATGAGTAFLTEFSRVTNNRERVKFLSIFDGFYYVGVLFGPILQWTLSHFQFKLFGLAVNALNGPGLIIAILSFVHILLTLVFYSNLTDEFNKLKELEGKDLVTNSIKLNVETSPLTSEGIWLRYKKELLSRPFVFLISSMFVTFTCQVAIETSISIVTQKYFGFHTMENTWIFTISAAEALLFCVLIAFVGKYVGETTWLILGWILLVLSLSWLMISMTVMQKGNHTHMVSFLGGIFVFMLACPIATTANLVLSSKVLSAETQVKLCLEKIHETKKTSVSLGRRSICLTWVSVTTETGASNDLGLGQGIRRIATYMGLIFGPNWAGLTIKTPIIFIGLLQVLLLLNGIMFFSCYKKLKNSQQEQMNQKAWVGEDSPLINQ